MPVSDGALSIWMGMIMYVCKLVSDSSSGRTMLIEAFSAQVRHCKALCPKAKRPGTMGENWEEGAKVYYIDEEGSVLKGRVKRRLETGEADYLLQSQKRLKVCEMYHEREDAEQVLAAAAAAAKGAGAPPVTDGGVKDEESEVPAATGATDPDNGKTKQVGAAPVGSPKTYGPAAGGKDSDTGTAEHIVAAPV